MVETPDSIYSDDIFYPKQRRIGRNDSTSTVPRQSSALSLKYGQINSSVPAPPVLVSSQSDNSSSCGYTSFSTDDNSHKNFSHNNNNTFNRPNNIIKQNSFFSNCDFLKNSSLQHVDNDNLLDDENNHDKSEPDEDDEDEQFRNPNCDISNYFSSIYVTFNSNNVFQPRFDTITEAERRAKSYTFGYDDYRIKKPTKGTINNFMRVMKSKQNKSNSITTSPKDEQPLNVPKSV